MAKKGMTIFKCSECGYSQPKWLGRCPECGGWNTMREFIEDPNATFATQKNGAAQKDRKSVV